MHVKGFVRALAALILLLSSIPALAQRPPDGIPEKVKAGLSSSSEKVRIAAIVAIGKTGHDEARPLLERMVGDEEPTVRAAAVEALGTLGDPAAIPVVRAATRDKAKLVAKIAASSLKLLEAKKAAGNSVPLGGIAVDLDDVQDVSGGKIQGLDRALQKAVSDAIEQEGGHAYNVMRGGVKKGWGLALKVRKLSVGKQGATAFVEVKCDMTVVELPGKILRLASSATTAAGIEGQLSPRMEEELARDAIAACGPSLAKDFLEYMKRRK